MATGLGLGIVASLTLIAVGAILRFVVAVGSQHGLNVHVVGVILILAGVCGLLLSLLVLGSPRRSRSLVRHSRSGYYGLPGRRSRLARTMRDAAADVAKVRESERFFGSDAPGHEEDDL